MNTSGLFGVQGEESGCSGLRGGRKERWWLEGRRLPRGGTSATSPGEGGRLGWGWPRCCVLSLPLLRPWQNECAAVGVPLPGLDDVALHPLPAAALEGVLERAEQSEAIRRRRWHQAANQAAQEGLG